MLTDADDPRDMDELFERGTQSVAEPSVLGQAVGLGGLGTLFVGMVSLISAGAIVAVGLVVGLTAALLFTSAFAG